MTVRASLAANQPPARHHYEKHCAPLTLTSQNESIRQTAAQSSLKTQDKSQNPSNQGSLGLSSHGRSGQGIGHGVNLPRSRRWSAMLAKSVATVPDEAGAWACEPGRGADRLRRESCGRKRMGKTDSVARSGGYTAS